jgi:hypothetical protein
MTRNFLQPYLCSLRCINTFVFQSIKRLATHLLHLAIPDYQNFALLGLFLVLLYFRVFASFKYFSSISLSSLDLLYPRVFGILILLIKLVRLFKPPNSKNYACPENSGTKEGTSLYLIWIFHTTHNTQHTTHNTTSSVTAIKP